MPTLAATLMATFATIRRCLASVGDLMAGHRVSVKSNGSCTSVRTFRPPASPGLNR
jgi:hypothetical protein